MTIESIYVKLLEEYSDYGKCYIYCHYDFGEEVSKQSVHSSSIFTLLV